MSLYQFQVKKWLLWFLVVLVSWASLAVSSENRIWYRTPAAKWDHALPVGNGRMGAMVFGRTDTERIQLNEDSLWPGGPDWGEGRGTPADLALIRSLLQQGDIHRVDSLIVEKFSYKDVVRSHQTMGDLFIEFGDTLIPVTHYSRALSMDSALVTVTYRKGNDRIVEQVFASHPDDVLVVQLSTSNPDGFTATVRMDRPMDEGHPTVTVGTPSPNELRMIGTVTQYAGKVYSQPAPLRHGVSFEARLQVRHQGGSVRAKQGRLHLEGVRQATLYLVSATSFYHSDFQRRNQQTLQKLANLPYEEILSRHVKDFQSLFKRVDFSLGGAALNSLPTDVRLARVKNGENDPDLITKLFQYGRYLLISCSRPGTNPANLQGLWNEHIRAPWNADYHLNINLQMNYWPAEVTNLSECHEPLFDFVERLVERGRITAKQQYGCSGAVVHHATDLWAPAWMRARTPYWGSWIHGLGWLTRHFWEHYVYSGDEIFLKQRAFPVFRAATAFYVDWLVPDPETGEYVDAPSTSPENSYLAGDGKPAAVAFGTAMGHQIIAEVFDHFLQAAEILNLDDPLIAEVKEKRKKLRSGLQIGPDGRLLEWDKPYDEPEKGHRHVSHLYALHPGNRICPDETPEFREAARKSLNYRLAHGGAGTGWSRAWMINFAARLHDGAMAEEQITQFLRRSVEINLFDMHPPFQVDGNFGFTAGVAELLVQSHRESIRLLPALPPGWQNGKITGLRARGGFEIGLEWRQGKLATAKIRSLLGKKTAVTYDKKTVELHLRKGETISLNEKLEL